jgi:tetratricopeptide (TPR) repeat protein
LPVARLLSPVSVSLASESDDDFSTARDLLRRGFPSGALSPLERVLRRGSSAPHYRAAIASLIDIARRLPDPSPAVAMLATAAPPDVPPDIAFLLGRHHYAADPHRALAYLDAVPPGSRRYLDARLLAGVIHVRLGRTAAAERAFQAVLAAPRAAAAVRDRALLDLGRLHYGARRYQRAADTFARIGRRSPAWPTALFESTWAYFRAGDAARGLGHIHSLKAPHFASSPFPEAAKVEAIFYFQRCHFRRAQRVTREFEERHAPVLRALERITAARSGDDAAFLATAGSLRAARGSPPASPASAPAAAPPTADRATRQLAAAALDDREVDRAIARVAELDRELARLSRAAAAWRASPAAVVLLQDLTLERHLAAEAAGRLTRARLVRLAGELRALMGDMRRIRIEILEIRAAHVGKTLPAEPEPAVFAIDDQNSYWPFDGEYWRDELGRYYVDLAPVCPAR